MAATESPFRTITHQTDLCVVGGGMSGICAAIAAARNGAQVVLVQDRPVLGGNASEEIRMWICGAHGANMRETGIIEEIELENIFRNPDKNYSQWSALLYEKVKCEPGVTLILNASVMAGEMDAAGSRLRSVTAWQTTTQRRHLVEARLFIDASGDSVLIPLTGAESRWGRESKTEFGEAHAADQADGQTMGMSCLIQVRETREPQSFVPPSFARRLAASDIGPGRSMDPRTSNFWWIEAGGNRDSIHDTEEIRDDLLQVSTGVWEFVKRQDDRFDSKNWTLEWMGFLPGKRESRRYIGDHTITQADVEAGGPFRDVVAYGGWTMDNHPPLGFYEPGEPTVFHPAPSPWGIPYRALYSRNIENLLCAGRNISATHIALSSSRVMRTCAIIGQAAGTAAAVALARGCTPRDVYRDHLDELQQRLMRDDAYLPGMRRAVSPVGRDAGYSASNAGSPVTARLARTASAACGGRDKVEWRQVRSTADPETLRNGIDRTVGDDDNGWWGAPDDWVACTFTAPREIRRVRIVFDSNLSRHYKDHRMKCCYPLNDPGTPVADTLVKDFRLELLQSGKWRPYTDVEENHQRLVYVELTGGSTGGSDEAGRPAAGITVEGVRLIIASTWGSPLAHLFAFEPEE